MWKNRQT